METRKNSYTKSNFDEYLQKGYSELENSRWRLAYLWFDKAWILDENSADAYIGRTLAEICNKSLESASENGDIVKIYQKIFSMPERIGKFIFENDAVMNKLFEHGYNFINNQIIGRQNSLDIQYILQILERFDYRDSSTKLEICNLYIAIENKAKQFREEILEDFFEKTNLSLEELENLTQEENKGKEEKNSEESFLNFLDKLEMSFTKSMYKKSYDMKYPLISVKLRNIDRRRRLHTIDRDPVALKKEFYGLIEMYDEAQAKIELFVKEELESDVSTFELKAKSQKYMVGFGKALMEKYSKL